MTSGAVERVTRRMRTRNESLRFYLLSFRPPDADVLGLYFMLSAISVRFLAHCVNGFYCILQHLFKILNRRNGQKGARKSISYLFFG